MFFLGGITLKLFSLLLCLILLAGCEQGANNPDLQRLTKELDQTLQEAHQFFEGATSTGNELATKEVEKLFTFEYRVEELDSSLSPEEMQEQLQALGQERWECFHAEPQAKSLRFFCKRRPKTYLRYIPKLL